MLKGFCVSFSPKIHNFLSVLAELNIFSHDILSQNYPCRCDGSAEIHPQNEESEFLPSALVLCLLLATSMLHDANTFNACGEKVRMARYFCLFILLLYVQSQQLWSWQDGQFTELHFFLGKLEQAVNQYFVHILRLVTDNNPS